MTILSQKRCALVLRVFAKNHEQVSKNVEQTVTAVRIAEALEHGGKSIFSKIIVAVALDEQYIDHDCGETAGVLREAFKWDAEKRIEVLEVHHGDLFCGLLNYTVARLLRDRCDYVTIASHGALQYLTEVNVMAMLEALYEGAKASGIAIEELQESILAGQLANTSATYDAVALMSVGGFDHFAASPRVDDRQVNYMRGWNSERGDLFYPLTGVEETITLGRLIEMYGPCIAPIMPAGVATWIAPNPINDPEGYARHIKKMGTKEVRKIAMAAHAGFDLSFLKGGVLPAHRLLN